MKFFKIERFAFPRKSQLTNGNSLVSDIEATMIIMSSGTKLGTKLITYTSTHIWKKLVIEWSGSIKKDTMED